MSAYTVTQENGLTIIRGKIPLEDLAGITAKPSHRNKQIAPDLADKMGARLVFGLPEDCEAARAFFRRHAHTPASVAGLPVDAQINAWLSEGEVGASSRLMAELFLGAAPDSFGRFPASPADGWDFRRCCLLLEWAPACKTRLGELRSVSPEWRALVDHWYELTDVLEAELPRWKEEATSPCSRLHRRIREVLKTAHQPAQ